MAITIICPSCKKHRKYGPMRASRLKTHLCVNCATPGHHGHIYSPINTYIYNGSRQCRICKRERIRRKFGWKPWQSGSPGRKPIESAI